MADEGIDASSGLKDATVLDQDVTSQAWVKFLGDSHNRAHPSLATLDEVKEAGCHWALTFPSTKRPRSVGDGAIMFIGRLMKRPNDIRVFGRAVGLPYEDGRDDATDADIAKRPWKAKWSRYIRVHHAEFVAGTMANGVSLNEMMDELKHQCFENTQRNKASGIGNTNPRHAYMHRAAVQLSSHGGTWLTRRLEEAFSTHGEIPQAELEGLDWPQGIGGA